MKIPTNLTPLELLGIAIQSEVESARYYDRIRQKVKSPVLQDKMAFLVREEKKHQHILTEFYYRRFPDVKLMKPFSSLVPKPQIPAKSKINLSRLLKAAMKAELEAEKFYNYLARIIRDTQSMLLLKYLAKTENGHYYLLKNELDLIHHARKIKDLTLLYQEDKAIHLGP